MDPPTQAPTPDVPPVVDSPTQAPTQTFGPFADALTEAPTPNFPFLVDFSTPGLLPDDAPANAIDLTADDDAFPHTDDSAPDEISIDLQN